MEEPKHLSVKDLAIDDRPREKLITKGQRLLSDAELLAIVLGSGSQTESAVDLAKRMLKAYNNSLHQLSTATADELRKFKGVGQAKAVNIVATFELARRRKNMAPELKPKISSSESAFEYLHQYVDGLPHEEFWLLLLNKSNTIISVHKISQGGISGTVMDIRLIMKLAIDKLAAGIILCHNHPSGNLNPSGEDKNITNKIKEASLLMSIQLLDHIIIGNNGYFSFADQGLI